MNKKNSNEVTTNAAYIRTSCNHEMHVLSQIASIMEAITNESLSSSHAVSFYIDTNHSSSTVGEAYKELHADIEANKISTLYVTDLSRVSRYVEDVEEFIDHTKAHSVTVTLTN